MWSRKPVLKFQLAQGLSYFYFWIAIAIPYLVYRDLTLTQALGVLSFYQLVGALLEYPTGVIADYFGHRVSLTLGHFIEGLGLLLVALEGPHYYYYFSIIFMATGGALVSGSDVALLKSISTRFKHDLSNYEIISHTCLLIVALLSGVAIKISFEFALVVSAVSSILSGFITMTLKSNPHDKSEMSIFSTAREGLKTVIYNRNLLVAIIFMFIAAGYIRSLKSIWGGFFEVKDIEIGLIGIAVASGMLSRIVGIQIAKYTQVGHIKYVTLATLGLLLLTAIFGSLPLLAAVCFSLTNLTTGLLNVELQTQISQMAPDRVRASVLSLNNLMLRMFTALYLFLSGVFFEVLSFEIFMLFTFGIFVVAFMPYFIVSQYFKDR